MSSAPQVHNSLTISGASSETARVCECIVGAAEKLGFDKDDLFAIRLSLEESLVNAIKHGNKNDPKKNVIVEYTITDNKFDVVISDEGQGFCPDDVPDPRKAENLCKSSGRGVLLINSYMDVVEYNQTGNSVHMIKYKKN